MSASAQPCENEKASSPAPSRSSPLENVEIVFQNEELIVINKPHDVAMDGDLEYTVEKWVLSQEEFLARPLPRQYDLKQAIPPKALKFVHQLDSPTSGILCLAFSRDMAARIGHCFQLRYTKKIYSAVLYGHLPQGEGWGSASEESFVEAGAVSLQTLWMPWPVGDDTADERNFRMQVGGEKGKDALTALQVVKRGYVNGCPATHVFLRPMSGRRHQLRVHCAHLGFPILGDRTYCTIQQGVDALERLALHAYTLTLFDRIDINGDTCRQRKADKRKRRRETLNLDEHETDDTVTFATTEPFSRIFDDVEKK